MEKEKYAIHCVTQEEFNRIMKLFNVDIEYMDWSLNKENTVLYPYLAGYGDIYGFCKRENYIVFSSDTIKNIEDLKI